MLKPTSPELDAEPLDAVARHSFDDLCRASGSASDWVVALIEQGAIDPVGNSISTWQFSSHTLVRVAKARRLSRDLDLTPSGVALVLDLLDQIEDLRARLQRVENIYMTPDNN
jgi:chaperone modulatory protein CbpM